MYFIITSAIYFIAIILINVSAAPDVVTENNTFNLDKSYPYHLSYKSGDNFEMFVTLWNFPPNNSSTVYVTYEADVRENRTKTDVYTGKIVLVRKILKDIIRVLVKVETKTDAGLCHQKILEATLEDKINTTGFALIDTCVGERCNVKANLTKGSCKDNEIPFTIWSATRCYGKSCDMANGTRNIPEIDEQRQRKIMDIIHASDKRIAEIIKNNSWGPITREVNKFDYIDTHIDIPQIEIQNGVTYNKDFIDMNDLRRKLKEITDADNLGSSCSPAMALVLLISMINLSFIHFV